MILMAKVELNAGNEMGLSFEEKAFYGILKSLCVKYDSTYPEDINANINVELILLLDKFGYPLVERDEVYDEISGQAGNFKKYKGDVRPLRGQKVILGA